MERLKMAKMRELEKQVSLGEISYSRMVELINEHFTPQSIEPVKDGFEKWLEERIVVLNEQLNHEYFQDDVTQLVVKHKIMETENTLDSYKGFSPEPVKEVSDSDLFKLMGRFYFQLEKVNDFEAQQIYEVYGKQLRSLLSQETTIKL